MEYEPVIGLEVHAQLLTSSKMFCPCSADYAGAPPNTHVCPVCLGMPGVLPVINQTALSFTVMTALALNCEIPEFSKFDRKNYPYPDLVKGYQISQYDMPLSQNGWLQIDLDGETKRVGIIRVHLEEDTAKLLHVTDENGQSYSLVDVNRSGVPLMEIVSAPDIALPPGGASLPDQAAGRSCRRWASPPVTWRRAPSGVTPTSQSGRWGARTFGTKTEVKNMNSFRAVQRALEYEIKRQTAVLERGGRIHQETRGWVEDRGVTVSQRSKEYAHDYRYFPEPDLPPLVLTPGVGGGHPDPACRSCPMPGAARFMEQYNVSRYDATLLTNSRATADFFEQTVKLYPQPKNVANWMQSELFRLLKDGEGDVSETRLSPEMLAELLGMVDEGRYQRSNGQRGVRGDVRQRQERGGDSQGERAHPDQRHRSAGDDDGRRVRNNPQAVADYRAGKGPAMGFLVGQVMKLTRGQANPGVVNKLLKQKLG